MTAPASSHDDDLRAQLLDATDLLRRVAGSKDLLASLSVEERTALLNAAGDVFCGDADERRLRVKARRKAQRAEKLRRDDDVLAGTGIRTLRAKPVFTTPNVFPPVGFEQADVADARFRETVEPQHCYVCKAKYSRVHHFYDQLCPDCAAFNYAKRSETADLSGTVALLTGGRVKIGAARYAAEADFAEWGDNLEIIGLDLRHTPSVEAFCSHVLQTRDRLDFIVNNACQTVRRPPGFYSHMMEGETAALESLSPDVLALVGAYAPAAFMQHFIVFVLACFIGFSVIWNVSHSLHTPLMAVTNAISGIVILGALLQIGSGNWLVVALAAISVLISTINIVGGFLVTRRMLAMFQKS